MFRPVPQLTRFDNLDRHMEASRSAMAEFSGPGVPNPIQSDLSELSELLMG